MEIHIDLAAYIFVQSLLTGVDCNHGFKSMLALQPGAEAKSLDFKQTQLDKTVSPEDNRACEGLYSCTFYLSHTHTQSSGHHSFNPKSVLWYHSMFNSKYAFPPKNTNSMTAHTLQ